MKTWFGRSRRRPHLGDLSLRQLRTKAAIILVTEQNWNGLDEVQEILDHAQKRRKPCLTGRGQRSG